MKKKYSFALLALALFISAFAQAKEKSCKEEIGNKKAKILVQQCLQISSATHPPCNVSNSCELIQSEIDRGCQMSLDKNYRVPKFCKKQN